MNSRLVRIVILAGACAVTVLAVMNALASASARMAPPTAPASTTMCLGDVNNDGVVNLWDLVLVGSRLGARSGERRYDPQFDLNQDGRIDLRDVVIVWNRLGTICSPAATPTSTPPPASPTSSATRTATATSTNTAVSTATATSTNTPPATATSTGTSTATSTATPVSTATNTATPTETATATATATNTSTATATATATAIASGTPTATATSTPVPTATNTPTATPTETAAATNTSTSTATATSTPDNGLPPDPSDVASAIDQTVATDIFSSTAFLYSGSDPIQTGVAPETIELRRVAVLRGRVLDRAEQPLAGVTIGILGHAEFGQTLSRSDGMFDMVVNGGGQLVLKYEKAGYLPSQRAVDAPWRDFAWAPDVVLVPLDSAVTTVDLTAGSMQTARGNPAYDVDGTRQATVLFPQGTSAEIVLPDGSTQPLSTLHVRATEYTIGDTGPEAMPAALPPSSGYTYAAELSVDEALAAGATEVRFSQPLPVYVENFLGFPVGGAAPTGYYDRQKGQWVASADGRVIGIVSITAGMADIDVDGDGIADSGAALTPLGVTDSERTRLAQLYTAGQSLWRSPVMHFSPWDVNWPFGPPADAIPPPVPLDDLSLLDNPTGECGSIIGCENQSLGESVPVVGTSLSLNYQSQRAPGRRDAYTLEIPVSGAAPVPASMRAMRVDVSVAGRLYSQTFAPGPNVTYTLTWDGIDGYGRLLQGARTAVVQVSYDYAPQYYGVLSSFEASFARATAGGPAIGVNRAAGAVSLSRSWSQAVGAWDERASGLGGWALSAHHSYDPAMRTLLFGDGTQRSEINSLGVIRTAAGSSAGFGGDGGPATAAKLSNPYGVAIGADGSIYIADLSNARIRRVDPGGVITTVAGNGSFAATGDGGPATAAGLTPLDVAVGPDGSLYIADGSSNRRIRRVGPDGIISTFAGTGNSGFSGDGGPAVAADIDTPLQLAVGPDGSIYFSTFSRVRRIGPDGIITTVAGTGGGGFVGDGGPATAATLSSAQGLAVGTDGSLFIADLNNQRIRRVSPDGIISTVAGDGSQAFGGDGGQATEAPLYNPYGVAVASDGSLFIAEYGSHRLRRVGLDGIISTIAGNGLYEWDYGDGAPAVSASLGYPRDVAMGPDGSIFVADQYNSKVRRIAPALPGASAADQLFPSDDGREVYLFSGEGRHLRTLDALTGAVRFQFSYDADGNLASVTDASGNVTTIERTGGIATAIVAPGGQRTDLTINPDGWLESVSDPLAEAHTMAYSAEGLLQTFADPMGNVHTFAYDVRGRLISDAAPDGQTTTLSRADLGDGYAVTTTSALGRTHTYEVEQLPTKQVRRTTIDPTGATTISIITPGVSEQTTFPGGATASATYGRDPRFGMLAPAITNLVVTTPGGKTRTITSTLSASLSNPDDLLSLTQLAETVTEAGNTRTRVYNAATRTFTLTTAEGRTSTATLDALGRMVSYQPGAGVSPIVDTYDPLGRLILETQGALTRSYGYDAANRLTSTTDGAGQTTTYAYDAADRMTDTTTPAGHHYHVTYDATGNVTSLTMPSGAVHTLGYTSTNNDDTYTAPGGTALDRAYSVDGEWISTLLGGGRTLTASYDSSGRPAGREYPEASVTFGYGDTTERVTTMTRSPLSGPAETVTTAWDANLPTDTTATGAAAGQYTFGYDARMLLTSMNLTSGADTANLAVTRDRDGLITKYGPFEVTHAGPAAAVNTMGDGQLAITNTYDAQGRLTQRRHVVGATTVYQIDLAYGASGQISQRTETTGAGAETRVYTYDADGQLTLVTTGGLTTESYAYDANGNRSSTSAVATYDAADLLSTLDGMTYTFDADGFLATRGADTFQFSARGELLSATVGGETVTYAYDALGRRVSRTLAGETTQYLYGNPGNPFQVTASREPSGALSVYYYGPGGVFAFDRAGARYYVAGDQVGSPRVITDATGAVVKTLQYDSYGSVLSDSDPSFVLALGYAGGIADPLTGFVGFGFRDYDPTAGRWIARDPALFGGGSWNLYGYVNADPVNAADPTGLWSITVGGSLYELLGGGASLTIGSDGFKVCGEVGVGFGGGLEVGASAKGVGDTSLTLSALAEVSAKAGPIKAGIGGELTRAWGEGKCTHGKVKFGVGITGSPFEVGATFDHVGLPDLKGKSGQATGDPGSSIKGPAGVGISAKVAAKACGGGTW